jgi:hypothetical protein
VLWEFLHQATTGSDKFKTIFQREEARNCGCAIFANAMTQYDIWFDTP